MAFWLVKSDPETYSWFDLELDGSTVWDGVRNFQARNNLKLMAKGDCVLVYHSNSDKAIMGIAVVVEEYFQDPTSNDNNWVAVRLKHHQSFAKLVTLNEMKANKKLENIGLIKQSRLSVMPLTDSEYDEIISLGSIE